MSDDLTPWEDDEPVGQPWQDDPSADTPPETPLTPAMSLSEAMAKKLGLWDTVQGLGELGLTAASGLVNEATRGYAGILGAGVGAVMPGVSAGEMGARFAEGVGDFTYEPKTDGGQVIGARVGGVMGEVAQGVKQVPASVYGAGRATRAAFEGQSPGAAFQAGRQEFMQTPDAMSEYYYQLADQMLGGAERAPEVAGAAGAAGALAPEVIGAAATPARPFRRVGRGVPDSTRAANAANEIRDLLQGLENEVPAGTFNRLQAAIQRGDQAAIADIDPSLGMVSDSAAFRQIEAGAASRADMQLTDKIESVRAQLNQRAQQLMDEQGADVYNPEAFSGRVEGLLDDTISDIKAIEERAWTQIRETVPDQAPVEVGDIAARMRQQVEDVGGTADLDQALGLADLNTFESSMFRLTHKRTVGEDGTVVWEIREPTYAAVDRLRKKIGQALGDRQNQQPFPDADRAELERMYGELAEAQGRVADDFELPDVYQEAKLATRMRKGVEEDFRTLAGNRLQNDVIQGLRTATSGLLKGQVKKFDEFFEAIPESLRPVAAAQALEQVFFTANKNTRMSKSWLANYEKLLENQERMNRLFRYLPDDARQQFIDIGNASVGFYRAIEKLNNSNTVNAQQVVKALEDPSFMAKLLGGVADQTTGRVPLVGDWINTVFRRDPGQRADAARQRLNRGVELLTDPRFREAVMEYAAGNVERANEILRDSQSWLQWTMETNRDRLYAAGIVSLFEDETDE